MATLEDSVTVYTRRLGVSLGLAHARRFLRARGLDGRLPTTADGVETAMVLVLSGLWMINITQLAIASHTAIERSSDPTFSWILQIAVVVRIMCWFVVVLLKRTVAVTWAILGDVAFGVVILSLQTRSIPPSAYNSWEAWAYAITLPCAFWAGIGLARMWQSILAGSVCGTAYLMAVLPGALASGDPVTPVTNSAAYLAFAVLGHAGASYLRRLAADADVARLEAARNAGQLERDRHRVLLHDQATVLQLLSRGEHDPDLDLALRRQAAVGAAEIRVFMTGRRKDRPGARDLAAVVRGAAAPFTDLPLTLNLELGDEVIMDPSVATALARAVATVLHNVRVHADAQSVVVHADSVDQEWEVVVRDDGVGFDPELTALGFGLSEQVRRAMFELGCRVRIESAVGEGTTVTLGGDVHVSPRSPDLPARPREVVPGLRGSDPVGSRRTFG